MNKSQTTILAATLVGALATHSDYTNNHQNDYDKQSNIQQERNESLEQLLDDHFTTANAHNRDATSHESFFSSHSPTNYETLVDDKTFITMKSATWCIACIGAKKELESIVESFNNDNITFLVFDGDPNYQLPNGKDPINPHFKQHREIGEDTFEHKNDVVQLTEFPEFSVYQNGARVLNGTTDVDEVRKLLTERYGKTFADVLGMHNNGTYTVAVTPIIDGPLLLSAIAREFPIAYVTEKNVFTIAAQTDVNQQMQELVFGMDPFISETGRDYIADELFATMGYRGITFSLPITDAEQKLFDYIAQEQQGTVEYRIGRFGGDANVFKDHVNKKQITVDTAVDSNGSLVNRVFDAARAYQFVNAQIETLPHELRPAAEQFINAYKNQFMQTRAQNSNSINMLDNLYQSAHSWDQALPTKKQYQTWKDKVLAKNPEAERVIGELDTVYNALVQMYANNDISITYPGTESEFNERIQTGTDVTAIIDIPTTDNMLNAYQNMQDIAQATKNKDIQYHIVVLPSYGTGLSFPANNAQAGYQLISPNQNGPKMVASYNGVPIQTEINEKRFINPYAIGERFNTQPFVEVLNRPEYE